MTSAQVRWTPSTVEFGIEATTGATDASFAMNEAAIVAAMGTWNAPSCSGIRIIEAPGSDGEAAPDDGVNTIAFRTVDWTAHGFPAGAVAFTDIKYLEITAGTWIVAEADIYLNAVDFTWSPESGDPASLVRSVRAVVTHELGHAIGILHPCEPGGAGGAPSCSSDAGFATTTMYPLYLGPPQQILSSDDIAAVCALYEPVACALDCEPGTTCIDGACTAVCGGTVCGGDEFCVADQCLVGCSGAECFATGSCTTNVDCAVDESCVGTLCLPLGGGIGDPCPEDAQCAVGECLDGYCRSPCNDGVCAGDYVCTPGPVDLCVSPRASFAESCDQGADCASSLCLLNAEPNSLCTRECGGPTVLPCPQGYSCDVIGGYAVCRPVPRSSGCSVTPHAAPSDAPMWVVLVMLFSLSVRVRSGVRR